MLSTLYAEEASWLNQDFSWCALQVREAIKASIPFVPASGGHSPWSTIGKDGFILDLSLYKHAVVDSSRNTVTVKGGLLMKELQIALSKERQFTSINRSTLNRVCQC